jgi:hypothetical protein
MKSSKLRPLWAVILFLTILTVGYQKQLQAGKEYFTYLPVVTSTIDINCDTAVSNYDTIYTVGSPYGGDPATNIEFNLGYRGYERTSKPRKLVTLGPVHDTKAPQFNTIFANNRLPTFSNTYQRYRWIDGRPVDTKSSWEVTVLGLATTPGEVLRLPDSGYDVGGGNDARILYASEQRLTLKYTGEDNIVSGYTVYIEGICVDPDLLALYNALHAAGRKRMPAAPGGTPLGRALGNEIKVAVRDTGHFLDPRSCNDWWQAHNSGC